MLFGLELDEEKNMFPDPYEGGLTLYDRFQYIDDRTRRVSRGILMAPRMIVDPFDIQPLQIPSRLIRKYRELVDRLNPSNRDILFRNLRLFI